MGRGSPREAAGMPRCASDSTHGVTRHLTPEAPQASGTRAPRRRGPARPRGARPAPRPSSRRVRRARARDPRAAAGRRRSRAARTRRPCDAEATTRKRSRATTTLSRTALERSPGAAASSTARGRGIATARSNRSRSARESFSRYAASRWALQPHSTAGSPRPPHGHMFIGPDELEARREDRMATGAGDRDDAVLERLPERLEDGARELGQLVEQQHAAVRERDLSRPRRRAASDDRRRGRSVVRERETAARSRAACRAEAGRRPNGSASPRAPPAA